MSNLLQVPVDQPARAPCAEADARLMQRLASGDQTAMQELIADHGDSLSRLLGRLTGWTADQEDLLQDVLVSIWERAGSFRGQGSLAGWLRMIAVNRCRNHHRTRRALVRLMESARMMLAVPESTPERSLETNELMRLAMQRLSSDDRTLIGLYYLEEIPAEEVASLLHINAGTMHVRLHRARGRLQRIIEQLESPGP